MNIIIWGGGVQIIVIKSCLIAFLLVFFSFDSHSIIIPIFRGASRKQQNEMTKEKKTQTMEFL